LYDDSLLDEYISLLKPISSYIKLCVAICDHITKKEESVRFKLEKNFFYDLTILPNKGSDIGPFLLQLKNIDSSEYPYFIKLHSKQSLWGEHKNIDWRILLVHSLIGNKDIFLSNLEMIDSNKNIGMIGNTGLMLNRDKEGFNQLLIQEILQDTLGLDQYQSQRTDLTFIAGSIFWSRTELFQQYFNDKIIDNLYALLISGKASDRFGPTYEHSLERVFGYIVGLSAKHIVNGTNTDTISILNTEQQKHYNLICCYNNRCYLDTNILVSGIYCKTNFNDLLINWKHKSYNGFWKRYNKIAENSYYC
jgi:lipopolysaccharide biosynthesis protein